MPGNVPVQTVVNAGGAVPGRDLSDDECEKIFQKFDPPIVCGTYDEVSKKRRKANKKHGKKSKFRNQQSEHLIANSSMQGKRGVNSTNIEGAKKYTEGSAFAYNVYDDQSAGTEHKFLTDKAKEFEKNFKGKPTLADRLKASEQWTKESLLKEDLKRTKNGNPRSRIKDASSRTKEETEALAEAAAKCLVRKAKEQFAKQGVSPNTETRKGLADKTERVSDTAADGNSVGV